MPENSTPKRPRPHRVDPRNPFVYDIREMGRQPGTMREHRRSVPAPAGLGLDLIAVPEGTPLDVDVRLEAVTEGVLVTGTVAAQLVGDCGRCLEPVNEKLVVDFVELFAYPDSATDETTDEDEVHRVEDDYVVIEPVVRDAVVLGLPFAPLCRPDCGGLCPECGLRVDDLPADHTHEQLDPRWAALAGFAETDAAPDQEPGQTTDQR